MNRPQNNEPRGLICPSCGGTKWEVLYTKHKPRLKAIQRRRRCLNCGKRITTKEIIIGN